MNISAPFLRPMSLPELLDQAFRLYRRNFLKLIGIIALPFIPLSLLQSASSYFMANASTEFIASPTGLPSSNYWLSILGTFVSLILQGIFVYGLAAAAVTNAVADDYTGQPIGVFDSYRKLGGGWLKLMGGQIIFWIMAFVWAIVPCIGWLTGSGVFVAGLWIVLPLLPAVVMLEKNSIFNSLRRAWDLARSRFWWMMGFGFVLNVFGQLIITGPIALITAFGGVFLSSSNFDLQQQAILISVLQAIGSSLGGLLYLPLYFTAATVIYFDLRIRSEGLDLALMAARESDPDTTIVSLAQTSPAPRDPFVSGQDLLNFLLIFLGIIVLYFLLFGLLFAFVAAMLAASGGV